MKILILSDDFPPEAHGGAGRIAYNIAKGLDARNHTVEIITTVRNKQDAGVMHFENLTLHRLHSYYHIRWRAYRSLRNFSLLPQIEMIIKEFSPDIVHAHNVHWHLSYASLSIARKYARGVFLTAHDAMLFHYGKYFELIDFKKQPPRQIEHHRVSAYQLIKRFKVRFNPLRQAIIHKYMCSVDTIFAVSNALKNSLEDNGFENIEVIHNGIDIADWDINDNEIKKFVKKYKLNEKKIILYSGRLSKLKGAKLIIETIKYLATDIPDTALLVAGKTDGYAQEMLGLAKKYNIVDKIIFTDWLNGAELKAAFQIATIVVSPSLYLDPFPTVNLEAMTCAKPVVTTCFGGSKEVVKNNVSGFVVNTYDRINFMSKVKHLLQDDNLSRKFGLAGKDIIQKEFSLTKQIQNTLSWYNRMLNNN